MYILKKDNTIKTVYLSESMMWRFISYQSYNPYVKNGLNDVGLTYAKKSKKGLIWLSGWNVDTVNVGYGQCIRDVVDIEEASRRGVVLVRRQGGGGAVFLEKDAEVSLSIVAPQDKLPSTHKKMYEIVTSYIIEALDLVGISSLYEPVNDVVTKTGKKISGGTLKKREGVVYIGATLLYSVDLEKMFSVLQPDKDKYKEKGYDDVKERVTSVKDQNASVSLHDVSTALTNTIHNNFQIEESVWKPREIELAKRKAKEYKKESWIFKR